MYINTQTIVTPTVNVMTEMFLIFTILVFIH